MQPEVTRATTRMANGKAVDIYRPSTRGGPDPLPAVLIWHGMGPDERDILRPVAAAVAAGGTVVFAPDWRSDAPDRGRAHLLDSLEFVRKEAAGHGADADRLVVAGWSAGAGAAVGLVTRPDLFDAPRPAAVVGLAGRYDVPARTTGTAPLDDVVAHAPEAAPVHLVHGTEDGLDVTHSRVFAEALAARSWPVRLVEPVSDHAGVLMSEYDAVVGRCVPSASEWARVGGEATVEAILSAAMGLRA